MLLMHKAFVLAFGGGGGRRGGGTEKLKTFYKGKEKCRG